DPAVPGVGHGVQRAAAELPVVGGVPAAGAGPLVVVEDDDELRAPAAQGRHQVGAQPFVRADRAVGVVEELDVADADPVGRLALFGLADLGRVGGRHAVDAGLAAGGQEIGDGVSFAGPDGDRSGRSELDVVGVGGQDESVLPVLGHTFQILAHEATVG